MIIGFDAKRLFRNFTGLGNYSRFVVSALQKHFPDNEYVLFSPSVKRNADTQPFLNSDFSLVQPSGVMRMLHPLWRSACLSFTAPARQLNIYHGLSQELPFFLPARVRKVVTVHDLIFYRFPQYYHRADVQTYKYKLRSACKRARRIVAISNQTAIDLQHYLNIRPEKIVVIHQGVHPQFAVKHNVNEIERVRTLYNLPQHYLLCVGTLEQRKNVVVLVEALARLAPSLQVPLVLVGRHTRYVKQVMSRAVQLGISHLVLMRNKVEFSHLPAVYQGSLVFLYPSLFEGFGIPIIEGIASGVPVITSTGSCFAEAGGTDTLYVSPTDAQAWADAIGKVLEDVTLRQRMVHASYEYIKRFSSENIARGLMEVYQELLAEN